MRTPTTSTRGFSDTAGLRGGQVFSLPDADAPGLLVRPDVARRQLEAESMQPVKGDNVTERRAGHRDTPAGPAEGPWSDAAGTTARPRADAVSWDRRARFRTRRPRREPGGGRGDLASGGFGGRPGESDARRSKPRPRQASRNRVVRIVTENSRTLKFESQGFEKE